MAVKKCPICKKTYAKVDSLSIHIESEHASEIPKDWSGGKYYFFRNNGRTTGKCTVCRKDTTFNEATCKTNRFCPNPRCPEIYREDFLNRMEGAGKKDIMNDAEHQKKMLSNRSIAKDYEWSDGTVKRPIGSYEYDYCRFTDIFMQLPSEDVMVPAPQVLQYEYEGKMHQYIPDSFIGSLNLIVEVKDGGDNPNMHHKIQSVDKVKEKAKERALKNYEFNYIKIENKQYGEFVELFMKLKNMDDIKSKKFVPIIITNEMVEEDYTSPIVNIHIVIFRDKSFDIFDEVGLLVGDKLYYYNAQTIDIIPMTNITVRSVYDVNVGGPEIARNIYKNIKYFVDMKFDYYINEVNFPIAFIREIVKQVSMHEISCSDYVSSISISSIENVTDISDYDKLDFLHAMRVDSMSSFIDITPISESVASDIFTNLGEFDYYKHTVSDIYNNNRSDFMNKTMGMDQDYAILCLDMIDKALSLAEIGFAKAILELDTTINTEIKTRAYMLLNNKADVIETTLPKIDSRQSLLPTPDLLKIHYTKLGQYSNKYNNLDKRVADSISKGALDHELVDEVDKYINALGDDVDDDELYYLGVKSI